MGFYFKSFLFFWFDNHRYLKGMVGQPDWKRDDKYRIDTDQNRFLDVTIILTNSRKRIGRRQQQFIILLLCHFNDRSLLLDSKAQIGCYFDFEITHCPIIGRCYNIMLYCREPTDIIVMATVSIWHVFIQRWEIHSKSISLWFVNSSISRSSGSSANQILL